MSKTISIESAGAFTTLLNTSTIVVADFYADWCGPCKAIAPLYEQLSSQLSRPGKITFVRINTDQQTQIAQSYSIRAMPTFLVFKSGRETTRIQGADAKKLSEAVKKLAAEANAADAGGAEGSSAGGSKWLGAELPKGYDDITEEVDVKGLDLLNSDADKGNVRVLFGTEKPSALVNAGAEGKGKGKASTATTDAAKGKAADWVESDTDEQLMLFVPFQATVKIHTLLITSLPALAGSSDDNDDDEVPMRPKTIHLYTNRANVLGFEEAEDLPATQTLTLKAEDWDAKTGTAKVDLRFVKFQKVTSLVVFVADGDGDGEKVRLDRLRFIGETGEKRAMGKLKKIGDEDGE